MIDSNIFEMYSNLTPEKRKNTIDAKANKISDIFSSPRAEHHYPKE